MKKLISTNPSKNYRPIDEVEISSLEEVRSKVAAAHRAKHSWRELGVEKRVALLKKAVDHFEKEKERLAKLISQEMGKPIRSAIEEMDSSLEYFHSYFQMAKSALKPEVTFENEQELHEVHREPYGVVAAIAPWNYPFSNFVWQAGQNLVAGNTIVFKHSEETPLLGKAIEEILLKYLPNGVFNEIYGGAAVGEILIHQDVNLIAFTGSTKAGIQINKVAAGRFIKTIMELGGSAPGILFEDSEVTDTVIEAIYSNRFSNCG